MNQLSDVLNKAVYEQGLFNDSKTWSDARPITSIKKIETLYLEEAKEPHFDLSKFIYSHFAIPSICPNIHDRQCSLTEVIDNNWLELFQSAQSDSNETDSLINLDHDYFTSGGRLREFYYWDSLFIGIAQLRAQNFNLVKNILDNYVSLINRVGYVPSGNRSYLCTRSAQPVFIILLQAYLDKTKEDITLDYYQALVTEYDFWMRQDADVSVNTAAQHLYCYKQGHYLNRYWDPVHEPRCEAFYEDELLYAQASNEDKKTIYSHIRAACESGWNNSSRWLKDVDDVSSIQTCNLLPVDLNCLLYQLEIKLSEYSLLLNKPNNSDYYRQLANNRKENINNLFWNAEQGFYFDYNHLTNKQSSIWSLAGIMPLLTNIASKQQAHLVSQHIEKKFLQAGGLVTTLHDNIEQWDSPLGFAPLHWLTTQALENYGYYKLSHTIKSRWVNTVSKVFNNNKELYHHYNVISPLSEHSVNEARRKDGYAWTNAVTYEFIASIKEYAKYASPDKLSNIS